MQKRAFGAKKKGHSRISVRSFNLELNDFRGNSRYVGFPLLKTYMSIEKTGETSFRVETIWGIFILKSVSDPFFCCFGGAKTVQKRLQKRARHCYPIYNFRMRMGGRIMRCRRNRGRTTSGWTIRWLSTNSKGSSRKRSSVPHADSARWNSTPSCSFPFPFPTRPKISPCKIASTSFRKRKSWPAQTAGCVQRKI